MGGAQTCIIVCIMACVTQREARMIPDARPKTGIA